MLFVLSYLQSVLTESFKVSEGIKSLKVKLNDLVQYHIHKTVIRTGRVIVFQSC